MSLTSFLADDLSGYSLENLPLGVGLRSGSAPSICTRVGTRIIDLKALDLAGLLSGPILSQQDCLKEDSLNGLMALGRPAWLELRQTLQRLLSSSEGALRDNAMLRQEAIHTLDEVQMQLPAKIGDYTDFYASRYHATNVGCMFRGKQDALNPNWVHLPVGYHGRASSIVVSGTDVIRPRGQVSKPGSSTPVLAPSAALDFELELACIVGPGSELGQPIAMERTRDHMFGVVLMNDWSARDIQKWEYVPLGPFNSKNWATSISPWVVTMDALAPFQTEAEVQDPPVLPHLHDVEHHGIDIQMSVDIIPAGASVPTTVTNTNYKYMYWGFPQMIAHHTVGGCNLRPGDMLGSGTISGPELIQRGCMLELTWAGANPLQLQDGIGGSVARTYLLDGDEVVMTGCCTAADYSISLGECRGKVLPALPA